MTSQLRIPLKDSLGREAFRGHSLRVSGARHMAQLGIPTPIVALLARWSSSVVLRYISDAPLASLTSIYRGKAIKAAMEGR